MNTVKFTLFTLCLFSFFMHFSFAEADSESYSYIAKYEELKILIKKNPAEYSSKSAKHNCQIFLNNQRVGFNPIWLPGGISRVTLKESSHYELILNVEIYDGDLTKSNVLFYVFSEKGSGKYRLVYLCWHKNGNIIKPFFFNGNKFFDPSSKELSGYDYVGPLVIISFNEVKEILLSENSKRGSILNALNLLLCDYTGFAPSRKYDLSGEVVPSPHEYLPFTAKNDHLIKVIKELGDHDDKWISETAAEVTKKISSFKQSSSQGEK